MPQQPRKLVLASNNSGKLAEFQHLFDNTNLAITLVNQGGLNISEAVEDGLTFVENALIKARHAAKQSGLPALADDSGLCVPVLNGRPGIYSARFAGKTSDDAANNAYLLKQLLPHRTTQPINAYFVCVLALLRYADDPLPIVVQGVWQGQILSAPKGKNGFGYDPLFWLPHLGKSSAELSQIQKSQISHRAIAMQSLQKQLESTPFFFGVER